MAWKKWLALPVLAAVLAACGGGGDDSRYRFPPLAQPESVHVLVSVTDAADGLAIAGAKLHAGTKVTVTIEGPAKDLVYAGGVPTTSFETTSGHVAFFVRPTVYPAVIRVLARAPNYISSSRELSIPGPGAHRVTVPLNSVFAGVPVGLASVSADANGVVAAGLVLSTPVSATAPAAERGSTTVVMAPNTRVTDKDGNPVTGTIAVRASYHNNIDPMVLEGFPGGLAVGEDPDGLPGSGALISGGFSSIEMAGGLAKEFDPPLTVTLVLPQGTDHPEMTPRRAVVAGDTIPLWAYDPATGEWSVLRNRAGVIQRGTLGAADANGNFPVTFETYHLSFFNLDWFSRTTCRPVAFRHQSSVTGAPLVPGDFGQTSLSFQLVRVNYGWAKIISHLAGESSATLLNVPANEAIAVMRKAATGLAAGPVQTFTLTRAADGTCGPILYAEAGPTPPAPTGSFTATVKLVCTQDNALRTAVEGAGVSVYSAGTTNLVAGPVMTDAAGAATVSSLLYGTYDAMATINVGGGSSQTKGVTVSGTPAAVEFLFPVDCPPVTGATGTGATGATGATGN